MKMKKWFKCLLMTMVFMMTVTTVAAGTTVPAAAKAKKAKAAAVKVGKTIQSGNFKYKVTSLKGKKGTATLTGTKSKGIALANVPNTVKSSGYTLTVNAIGNGAFQNCKKLKKVVTNTAIKQIGNNAFSGCKQLTAVTIKSTMLTSVGKNAMSGISKKAVISVPRGKGTAYSKMLKVSVSDPYKGAASATTAPAAATCGKKHLGLVVVSSIAPTCEKPGTSSYEYCTVCGYRTQPIPLSAIGHHMVAHAEVPATCHSEGRTAYESCSRCGYETGWSIIPKLPHTWVEVPGKAATCTARGWKAYSYCQECYYQQPISYLPALGHNYATWTVEKDATCTEKGLEKSSCTRCQAETTRAISAKGHRRGERQLVNIEGNKCYARVTYPCLDCGYVEYTNSVIHRDDVMQKLPDIPATCTTPGQKNISACPYCTVKNFTYVSPLGHNFCTETQQQDPTCVANGCIYRKCSRCDQRIVVSIIPATEHTWHEESKAATCTEDGFTGKICSVCNAKEGTTVRAKGHQYKVTDIAATCDANGEHKEVCTVCGEVKTAILPMLGHTWKSYPRVEATCARAGHEAYDQCTRCGAYKNGEPQRMEQLAHNWQKTDNIVPSDEEDSKCGVTYFVHCENCHAYKVIPGKGHTSADPNCLYNRLTDHSSCIQWTVFLSSEGWEQVDIKGLNSNLGDVVMNERKYAAYIPALRGDVQFKAPVPNCPAGKVFKGWQQMVTSADGVATAVGSPVMKPAFGPEDACKTFVAVFESAA